MHVGVVGINHKQADVTLRELIAAVLHTHFSPDHSSFDAGCVVLSTCNRIELYFSAYNLAEVHQKILLLLKRKIPFDFEQKLYTFFGVDCFIHLAKVVSGLDSAIIGETEIKRQVGAAYNTFHKTHRVNKELHYLFQKSLKISKKIRSEILLHTYIPGIEELIHERSYEFFRDDLPNVLFVGASTINLKIARYFVHKMDARSITFCTRTNNKAQVIAEKLGIAWTEWADLKHAAVRHDLVITAAKSPSYLLSSEIVQEKKKLLIDLAVPRNIDPKLAQLPHVRLINIDSFSALQEEHCTFARIFEAEECVESEATKFFELYSRVRQLSIIT